MGAGPGANWERRFHWGGGGARDFLSGILAYISLNVRDFAAQRQRCFPSRLMLASMPLSADLDAAVQRTGIAALNNSSRYVIKSSPQPFCPILIPLPHRQDGKMFHAHLCCARPTLLIPRKMLFHDTCTPRLLTFVSVLSHFATRLSHYESKYTDFVSGRGCRTF